MIENIPNELRSDRALKDYFEKLFSGKVHSACVVLNVPDLEDTSRLCIRTCRQLEKSIAYMHANGKRPSHRHGQGRVSLIGLDIRPCEVYPTSCCCMTVPDPLILDLNNMNYTIAVSSHRPPRGTRVDSITCYTIELAEHSQNLKERQRLAAEIAESGNLGEGGNGWIDKVMEGAESITNQIMKDYLIENSFLSPLDFYFATEKPQCGTNDFPIWKYRRRTCRETCDYFGRNRFGGY